MAKCHPHPTDYDAIERILREHGKDVRRANLRRHILSYIEAGYVERVKDGAFRATEKGKKAAGLLAKGEDGNSPQDETPDVVASGVSRSGNGAGTPLPLER